RRLVQTRPEPARPASGDELAETHDDRFLPAPVTVAEVTLDEPAVALAVEPFDHLRHHALDAAAALAGRDLVVFVLEPTAGAEENALDRRTGHSHSVGDL